jgi:non-specific serine/threonine protein kinase
VQSIGQQRQRATAGLGIAAQPIAECAGQVAQALRPAGYDAEVVYLLTVLQNLGRLVMQYHFADEARQIHRLMQPAPPVEPGQAAEPGMPEEAASFAVLGVDAEAIGAAVARHWGLDESVLLMIRRLPGTTAVHEPDGDGAMLRVVASCANDVVDALQLGAQRSGRALERVAHRYARALGMTPRDLLAAVQPDAGGRTEDDSAAAEPDVVSESTLT